jgi:hypothetical protein
LLNRFGTWEARVKADAAAEVLKNAACTTSRARPAIRERAVAAAKMAVLIAIRRRPGDTGGMSLGGTGGGGGPGGFDDPSSELCAVTSAL